MEALEKSKTPVSSVVLDRFDEVGLNAYFDYFFMMSIDRDNFTRIILF